MRVAFSRQAATVTVAGAQIKIEMVAAARAAGVAGERPKRAQAPTLTHAQPMLSKFCCHHHFAGIETTEADGPDGVGHNAGCGRRWS